MGVEYGGIFIFWTRPEDSAFMQRFDILHFIQPHSASLSMDGDQLALATAVMDGYIPSLPC